MLMIINFKNTYFSWFGINLNNQLSKEGKEHHTSEISIHKSYFIFILFVFENLKSLLHMQYACIANTKQIQMKCLIKI